MRTLDLQVAMGGGHPPFAVRALAVPGSPDLAVHRAIRKSKDGSLGLAVGDWVVTHVPSTWSIRKGFRSKAAALGFAAELLQTFPDWSMKKPTREVLRERAEVVLELFAKWTKEGQ